MDGNGGIRAVKSPTAFGYKPSIYNHYKAIEHDTYLVYNLVTSSVALLTENEKTQVEHPERADAIFLESALENGFAVPVDENEVAKVLTIQRMNNYSSRFAGFQILPTTACNASCRYCYEKGLEKETMSSEVIEAIPGYLESYMDMIDDLHVTWFGGEPMLGLQAMRELSEAIKGKCGLHGIGYTSDIITNATLLTPETVEILADECNVSQAQVTLDGMGSTHMDRKRYLDPSFTFDKLLDSMELLVRERIRLLIRLNIDRENIGECIELISKLGDKWARNDNVMLYAAPLYGSDNDNEYFGQGELNDAYGLIFKAMINAGWIQTLDGLPMNFNNATCSARMVNNFVINPKGEIFKCEHLLSDADERLGTVFDGVTFNSALVRWTSPTLPQRCIECGYLPSCQGGCYAAETRNFGFERCPHIAFIEEAIVSSAGYLLKRNQGKGE